MRDTTTIRRTGTMLRPAIERGWFVNLFLQHPLAKLFSLGFAILVVMLIDRELMQDIYDREVRLVANAGPNTAGRVVIRVDDPYMVLIEDGAEPVARLLIQGREKQRDRLLALEPFRVSIPQSRLDAALRDQAEGVIAVEEVDFDLGNIPTDRITLSPKSGTRLEVKVARKSSKEVPLVADGLSGQQIEFRPARAKVIGPTLALRSLEELRVDLGGDLSPGWVSDRLAQALMRQSPFLSFEKPESIRAAKRPAPPPETFSAKVSVYALWVPDSQYEFKSGPSEDGRGMEANLDFRGPPSVVAGYKALTEDKLRGELEERFIFFAPLEREASKYATDLLQKARTNKDNPDEWWMSINVDVYMYDNRPDPAAPLELSGPRAGFQVRLRRLPE